MKFDICSQTRYKADLSSLLKGAIECFVDAFILIDALDECRKGAEHGKIPMKIAEMRDWKLPHLHLLVTSRNEKNNKDHLNPQTAEEIRIEHQNEHIHHYVQENLRTDDKLKKWFEYHEEIKTALTGGAQEV